MDDVDPSFLPGPATLWGILVSEYREDYSWHGDVDDWNDSLAATDEGLVSQEEDKSTREPLAGLAIPWGVLPSDETCFSESINLDSDAMANLWTAAGYDCRLPTEENASTSPAISDALPTNGEAPTAFSPPPTPTGPFIIKHSPGKGQGIFAARNITKGDRILIDNPFFVVAKPYNNLKVLQEFEKMPLASRQLYMQLTCPSRTDDVHLTDVMCILEANCFNIGDSSAVFLTATRFNHSCLPNTFYSWSETKQEIGFHSMIEVKKGEELTICYGYPFQTRLERRSQLRIYNFSCDCPACQPETAFGIASEERRMEMRDLDTQISSFQQSFNEALLVYGLRDPLTAVLRLIELVKEEGLWGESMTPYRNAADYLRARGNFEEAVVFARLNLEEERVCFGVESEVVRETEVFVRELEMEMEMVGEEGEGLQTEEDEWMSELGLEDEDEDEDVTEQQEQDQKQERENTIPDPDLWEPPNASQNVAHPQLVTQNLNNPDQYPTPPRTPLYNTTLQEPEPQLQPLLVDETESELKHEPSVSQREPDTLFANESETFQNQESDMLNDNIEAFETASGNEMHEDEDEGDDENVMHNDPLISSQSSSPRLVRKK